MLVLGILIQSGLPCMANDTTKMYCMPLQHARYVFEDALKAREYGALIKLKDEKINLLNANNNQQYLDFSAQLSIEQNKTKIAQQQTKNQEDISSTNKDEAKSNLDSAHRFRNQRNAAIVGWVLTIGGFLVLLL